MTETEERELRDAIVLVANALGMDEADAFRNPLRFAVRAGLAIYGLKQQVARLSPTDPKEIA
jgi:hypothetical protein